MNNVINWFEIPVVDMDRAMKFYSQLLAIEFRQETISGIENAVFPYTHPATGGALVKGEMFTPASTGVVVYLHTADIASTLTRLEQAGGSKVFGPEVLPHDIGTIALFTDSEGNRVGLHQPA
ncbi:hypothetical protein EDF73_103162 [Raoultella sp. BIGb0138]|uniref:VOC family protein n=1 Tax=Raoultella sp. BIGb0138 TaxID=2485115 RepID=UPI0010455F79|nr:VOC family protein [Raoultella sp. BIGb0138]TCW15139.1 hypothetical protein EDF73_103162 [Raoultella sp. BIGb0138]